MDLERALYRHEKLKKKADELDKWLDYQTDQSREDRKHHLSLPNYPDFIRKIGCLIEEIREEEYELEDKIKKAIKGIVIE